jgi:hypothetical protein
MARIRRTAVMALSSYSPHSIIAILMMSLPNEYRTPVESSPSPGFSSQGVQAVDREVLPGQG